jgi:hypothetical protein
MRLIHRNRHDHGRKRARIAITEAEISADLHYPARAPGPRAATARRLEAR